MEEFKLQSSDGANIHIYGWASVDEPVAVMQIAHGMAEHGARYERLAHYLNQHGIAVYANDHRGHGKTVTNGEVPGHMADKDGWRFAVEDLAMITDELKSRHPGLPVILMGHSMGSFMVQDYLSKFGDKITAVALSATNGPPGTLGKLAQLVSRIEQLRNGKEGHSTLLANMSFKAFNKAFAPNRTEFDWLSRDEAEVDKYVNDPLCGFDCSIATWIGLLDALTRIARDDAVSKMNKTTPIYLFSGTKDPVGENTKGVERLLKVYRKHDLQNVTHKYYEEGRHELLNDINRDEVMQDLLRWINTAIGRA